MRIETTYSVRKWEEETYREYAYGKKLTRATVEYVFAGEMEGTAFTEYLMHYSESDPKDPHLSTASYMGHMEFRGRIGGRDGTFVLEDRGGFGNGTAKSGLRILEDSGTAGFQGISGSGSYSAGADGIRLTLELSFK